MNMRKPLEGMKILEIAGSVSGFMCTLFLSDYGAEVIKIQQPGKAALGISDEENVPGLHMTGGKGRLFLISMTRRIENTSGNCAETRMRWWRISFPVPWKTGELPANR